jgi:hypothetical protein
MPCAILAIMRSDWLATHFGLVRGRRRGWGSSGLGLLIAINMAQVGLFGELEYWSRDQRSPRLILIAVGLVLVTASVCGRHRISTFGGPEGLAHGWSGVRLALTLVITSYMGIEVIAVTAGEAEHPETSILVPCGRWCCGSSCSTVAMSCDVDDELVARAAEGGGHHRQPLVGVRRRFCRRGAR